MDKQLAKKTDKVLFVEIKNDGFDLGAQRREIDKNDIPKALELINEWQNAINTQTDFEPKSELATLVEKSKIAENEEYNLTAPRYREQKDYSNCKWEMVKIGDVFITTSGGTPLKSKEEYYYPEEIPWICSGEVRNGEIYSSNKFISKLGLKESSAKIIPANSVLVAMYGATAGQVGLLKFEAATNQAICSILPNKKINSKYLYYILKSRTERMLSMSVGGAQPNISQSIIKSMQIPLPPLEVQEEIAKELDSYQAVIDGAQKVVDNWKPTLPINPNWNKAKIKDLYNIKYGVTVAIPDNIDENGIKIISTAETTIDGYLNLNKVRKVKFLDKYKEHILHPDTLLFNWRNAPKHVGKTVLFNEKDEKYICASFLLPMENIAKDKVNNIWAWYEINRLRRNGYFMNNSRQAVNQTNFNGSLLGEVEIYLPSMKEQIKMVEIIKEEEKAIEECKKLIEIHQAKINAKIQSIWGENIE